MDRRDFLKNAASIGAGAVLLSSCSHLTHDEGFNDQPENSEAFNFVHITDQHVQLKRQGDKGYLECIKSVNRLNPKPAFALMGGDLAFDGNYNPKEKFVNEIKLYKSISDKLECPYFHCIGNHDTLGLNKRRKIPVTDPDIGKKCIMDILEWPSSYYSFDYRGWHFIVLDSIKEIEHPDHGPIYTTEIDEKQMEWLAADLGSANGRPTVAVTHIAAFCNIGQINGDKNRKSMDGSMVLNNNRDLRRIFERHNVKALLQGHSHDIENFYYNGIWYITSAAASGAWWSGNWTGSKTGYTVLTCGKEELEWKHKTYDWDARFEPEDTYEEKKVREIKEEEVKQENLRNREILKGKTFKRKKLPKLSVKL
jgi:3',5'-cyclic-AMP phosphodiesterase